MSLAFPEVLPARTDERGAIAVDFPCGGCGYNLRAQALGAACPECGRTIDAAAQDAPLERADADYVARVRRGARRLWWGVALTMPLVYPGLFVVAAGVWLLTGKEPGAAERWSVRNGRLLARWLVVLGTPAALASALWMAWQLVEGRGLGGSDQTWRMIDTVLTGTHAAVFMGCMFAWRHVFDLAARADGAESARTLRRLWRRYFHVLLFIGGTALAVNAYDALGLERWLDNATVRQALPALVVVVVWAVLAALWWQTLRATRALSVVINRVDRRLHADHPAGRRPDHGPGGGPRGPGVLPTDG